MKSNFALTLGALLGCGLMAGLFFAFSACVMKALGGRPPREGIAAMQAINVAILNPIFFAVFMGTAILCLWALVFALRNLPSPGARWLLAGSVFYLIGALLVTMVFNVPMNDALAKANPDSAQGERIWANYLSVWTAWNHLRTVSSLAATACFALALRQAGQSP